MTSAPPWASGSGRAASHQEGRPAVDAGDADDERAGGEAGRPDEAEEADDAAARLRRGDLDDPGLAGDEDGGGGGAQGEADREPGVDVGEHRQKQECGNGRGDAGVDRVDQPEAADQPRRDHRPDDDGQGMDRRAEADEPAVDALGIQPQRQQRPDQAGHHSDDGNAAGGRGHATPALGRGEGDLCHA